MKVLKKIWFWLGILLVFLGICAWPIRWAFTPSFLTQTHLVLLMNEAEARPCGGFVTATGEVRLFPLKISLQNSYALTDKSFGIAQPPLDMVASEMKFWDLGTTPDMQTCSDFFHGGAKMAGIKHSRVIFISNEISEKIIDDPTLFADMTRMVANVDRHDEQSLAERKSPLASFGKKVVLKTFLKPWTWPRITRDIGRAVKSGELYVSGISPELKPLENDITAIEWNLGGGKSSRFLKRNLEISAREITPNHWRTSVRVRLEHLGQADEPLSQAWRGGVEMRWPKKWSTPDEFLSLALAPGQTWGHEWVFEAEETLENISLFVPRGQTWDSDVRISLFGQTAINSANLDIHENVGTWDGKLRGEQKKLSWATEKDITEPFVTLHEWLNMDQLPEEVKEYWGEKFASSSKRFSVAEIHFSEPVVVTNNLRVTFTDKDFENEEITEDPTFYELLLWNGGQTALIGFWQNAVQPDERFSVSLEGITDIFENKISNKEYTIIDRTK